jgi:transposase-like protein
MIDRPSERWVTIEEAARAVHASPSLIEKWAREGRVATRQDPTTHSLLVSADDIEDLAEEEAFRRLSQRALA